MKEQNVVNKSEMAIASIEESVKRQVFEIVEEQGLDVSTRVRLLHPQLYKILPCFVRKD